MKKAFVLALALVLTMGLAVPAAAVGTASPTAPTTSTTTTAPLPEVTTPQVTAEDGTVIVVDPVASDDIKLTEEEKTALAAAQAALGDAAPAGMKAQYFFYVRVYAQADRPSGRFACLKRMSETDPQEDRYDRLSQSYSPADG